MRYGMQDESLAKMIIEAHRRDRTLAGQGNPGPQVAGYATEASK
jgi:hypothetical protein